MEAFAFTQATLRCPACASLPGPSINHGSGSAIPQACSLARRTCLSGRTALLHEAHRKRTPQKGKRVVWVRAKKGKSSTSVRPSSTVRRRKVTISEDSVLRDYPWILVEVSVSGERHAEVYEKVLANQRKGRGFAPGRPSLKGEVDSIVHSTLVRQVSPEVIKALPFVVETPEAPLYFVVDRKSQKSSSEDPSAEFKYSLLLHLEPLLMDHLIQMAPLIRFTTGLYGDNDEASEASVMENVVESWKSGKDDMSKVFNMGDEQIIMGATLNFFKTSGDDVDSAPRYLKKLPKEVDIKIQWGYRETDRNYWGRMYPDLYSPEAEGSVEFFFDGLDNPVVNSFKAAAGKMNAVKDATSNAKEAVGGWISRLPFVNAKQEAEELKIQEEEKELESAAKMLEEIVAFYSRFLGGRGCLERAAVGRQQLAREV